MYYVKKSSKGFAIFFKGEFDKKETYISDNLSLKQANKWCTRLNKAYEKGFLDGSY